MILSWFLKPGFFAAIRRDFLWWEFISWDELAVLAIECEQVWKVSKQFFNTRGKRKRERMEHFH